MFSFLIKVKVKKFFKGRIYIFIWLYVLKYGLQNRFVEKNV